MSLAVVGPEPMRRVLDPEVGPRATTRGPVPVARPGHRPPVSVAGIPIMAVTSRLHLCASSGM